MEQHELAPRLTKLYPNLEVKYYPGGGPFDDQTGTWTIVSSDKLWLGIGFGRIDALSPHPDLPFDHYTPPNSWRIWKLSIIDPNYFTNLRTLIDAYVTCASSE